MEAKELMIGDWVKYHDQYKRVEYIYCRPLPNGTNPVNEVGVNEDSWVNADNIEPIPLTEDILRANGFTTSNDYSFHYDWITLQTDNIAIGFSIWICGRGLMLKYVHELQHALRLCGLNELAGNFKLKAMEEQI